MGEEEEVLLEGVGMEMEEEETGQDLSVGVVCKKIMRSRAHAEVLPIFYRARKWREIRQAGRRWRRVHII